MAAEAEFGQRPLTDLRKTEVYVRVALDGQPETARFDYLNDDSSLPIHTAAFTGSYLAFGSATPQRSTRKLSASKQRNEQSS